VEASGIGEHLIYSLTYEWNFGDGDTVTQMEATHSFQYPGTYVVVVYAGFKRQEQIARHTITVLPVALSLTTSREGDVQVNSDSPYEVDLSGYRLVGGAEAFIFAPRTILLPNQTITIPRIVLGKTIGAMVAVYDAEGALLASRLPAELQSNDAAAKSLDTAEATDEPFVSYSYPVSATAGTFSTESEVATVPAEVVTERAENRAQPAAAITAGVGNGRLAYVGFALVLLLATVALYTSPKRNEMV
jgi:PKD repeat protein